MGPSKIVLKICYLIFETNYNLLSGGNVKQKITILSSRPIRFSPLKHKEYVVHHLSFFMASDHLISQLSSPELWIRIRIFLPGSGSAFTIQIQEGKI